MMSLTGYNSQSISEIHCKKEMALRFKTSQRWLKILREELETMRCEYTHPQESAVFTQDFREQIEQLEMEINLCETYF